MVLFLQFENELLPFRVGFAVTSPTRCSFWVGIGKRKLFVIRREFKVYF